MVRNESMDKQTSDRFTPASRATIRDRHRSITNNTCNETTFTPSPACILQLVCVLCVYIYNVSSLTFHRMIHFVPNHQ